MKRWNWDFIGAVAFWLIFLCACAAFGQVTVDNTPWQAEKVVAYCPPVRPSPYPYPPRPQQPSGTFAPGASQQPSLNAGACTPATCGPNGCNVKPQPATSQKQPGTIVLISVSAKGGSTDVGTGWVLGQYIVTCAHTFRDRVRDRVAITLANGNVIGGALLAIDPIGDVAVVQPEQSPPETLALAAADPQKGQKLQFCGLAGGFHTQAGLCLSFASSTQGGPQDVLVMSGTAASGDSGGPIYDDAGAVVGLITGSTGGKAYGPKLSVIQTLLSKLPSQPPNTPPVPEQPGAYQPQPGPTDQPTPANPGSLLSALHGRVQALEQTTGVNHDMLLKLKQQIASNPTAQALALQVKTDVLSAIADKIGAAPAEGAGTAALSGLLVSLGVPGGIAVAGAGLAIWLARRAALKLLQSHPAGSGGSAGSASALGPLGPVPQSPVLMPVPVAPSGAPAAQTTNTVVPPVVGGGTRTENYYIGVPTPDQNEEAKRSAERRLSVDPKCAAFFSYRDRLAQSQMAPTVTQ